jgi:3-deoxy-7-phosphoheptulonate synthase/chorismate mutase
MASGNDRIILCERGIRTFETSVRFTLDLSAVALLKNSVNLPVLVDVSHGTGRKDIMIPMAKAALASGSDGIMVEVHPNPTAALSDSLQQMDFNEFSHFLAEVFPRK